ncbi:MAG: alcohol dehydrogenase catalytic domain-containing protein, partial [Candidatus Bathyarchaeia archaeon]
MVKTEKGVGFVELLDVPEPRPGPNEVLVEVKAAGICGTDIHIYHDEFPYNPPVVLGHEFCGLIAEVGENVTGWEPGDRVTCETAGEICGRCLYCRTGRYNLCPERMGLGYNMNGAFAEYVLIPRQEIIHRLPEDVDFVSGALCEPSASVTHAVIDRTKISGGDFVVVTGDG